MANTIRIMCVGCGEAIDLTEQQLGTPLVCGDCNTPIDYRLYPPVLQRIEERNAKEKADRIHEKAMLAHRKEEERLAALEKTRREGERSRRQQAELAEAEHRRWAEELHRRAELIKQQQADQASDAGTDPNAPVKCPKCSCTQITASRKGFSVGKAVGFTLLLGPLGILAGASGASNVKVTCLRCGHSWMAGQ